MFNLNPMNIFTKFKQKRAIKQYQKYRNTLCPKCNQLNWNYCFAPYLKNKEKCSIEARVCKNCGYKDTNGHIISNEIKLNSELTFKVSQK